MKVFKGMDDNQFWAVLWTVITTGVIIIVTGFTINSALYDRQLHDLLDKGHDPIELACLYRAGNTSTTAPCMLLIQERVKEEKDSVSE